jgi:uncharacterized protein YjdB
MVTIDTNGLVTVTNAGPAGSYTVTVTATDNCGAQTRTFTLTVANTFTFTGFFAPVDNQHWSQLKRWAAKNSLSLRERARVRG